MNIDIILYIYTYICAYHTYEYTRNTQGIHMNLNTCLRFDRFFQSNPRLFVSKYSKIPKKISVVFLVKLP